MNSKAPASTSIQNPEAIVVLPAAADGSVGDKRVRAWLARADLEWPEAPQEILPRVVAAIGQPASNEGHAALRFWGQTGDRPTDWMAAADPVYLDVRLDHVRLRRLWPNEWQDQEWQQLMAELQATLAADGEPGIVPD